MNMKANEIRNFTQNLENVQGYSKDVHIIHYFCLVACFQRYFHEEHDSSNSSILRPRFWRNTCSPQYRCEQAQHKWMSWKQNPKIAVIFLHLLKAHGTVHYSQFWNRLRRRYGSHYSLSHSPSWRKWSQLQLSTDSWRQHIHKLLTVTGKISASEIRNCDVAE